MGKLEKVANNANREWARKEVELAIEAAEITGVLSEQENKINKDVKKHYETAFAVFEDFLDKTEGLDAPDIVKSILAQLLRGDTLTPIDDNEEDWNFISGFDPVAKNDNPGYSIYLSERRPSLIKKVSYERETGDVVSTIYTDTERAVCIDINTNGVYTGGFGLAILDEMFPIAMPYQPDGKIKIFYEDFKYYRDSEDADTIGILYFRMPDGKMEEVKRFFKKDPKTHVMIEINRTEYFTRKQKSEEDKKKGDN